MLCLATGHIATCRGDGIINKLHFPQQIGFDDKLIYNENLGIVLTKVGTIELGGSEFKHTFGIPILKEKYIPELNTCPPDLQSCFDKTREFKQNCTSDTIFEFCRKFQESIQAYTDHQRLLREEYTENHKAINSLLPRIIIKQKHGKRGLIDAGGWLAKQLFGVATEADLTTLRNHIEQIEGTLSQANASFDKFEENLQSFGVTINNRVNNIKIGLQLHQKLLNDTVVHIQNIERTVLRLEPQINQFYKRQHKIMKYINLLHVYNAQHIHILNAFVRDSTELLSGVQTLVEGYLPSKIIPPHILTEYLFHLDNNLKKSSPGFTVTHKSASYYYHVRDIMYARSEDNLFISIKIPLSSTNTIFKLYKVETLPVPMAGLDLHTEISNVPKYFAVSSDQQFYLELKESEIKDCPGSNFKKCNHITAIKERSLYSCISSIYFKNQPKSVSLCKGQVIDKSENFKTRVINLEKGKLLVSTNDPNWIKSCANSPPVTIKVCSYCIIHQICYCSFRGPEFFIPAKINNCLADRDIQMIQPYNAIFSKHFYTEAEILSGNNTSKFEYNTVLEPLKIDLRQSQWNDVLSIDKQLNLEVDTLAKLIKSGKPLFSTPIDKLRNQLDWVLNDYSKTCYVTMTIVSVTLSVTSLVISAITIRKINKIVAIITSLSVLATETHAKPTNENVNQPNCENTNTSLYVCLSLISIIILAYFLYKLVKRRFEISNKQNIIPSLECDLFLYVYTTSNSYKLFICKVPFKITNVCFGEDGNLTGIKIKKDWMKCSLMLQWMECALYSKETKTNFEIPDEIPLSYLQEKALRKILHNGKTFKLVITNYAETISSICNINLNKPDEYLFKQLKNMSKIKWSNKKETISFK